MHFWCRILTIIFVKIGKGFNDITEFGSLAHITGGILDEEFFNLMRVYTLVRACQMQNITHLKNYQLLRKFRYCHLKMTSQTTINYRYVVGVF